MSEFSKVARQVQKLKLITFLDTYTEYLKMNIKIKILFTVLQRIFNTQVYTSKVYMCFENF